MKRKVVVIGGGNGSMLSIYALKHNQALFDISAVISMSDSGGSSGRLRREFDTTPPGDIMRAVLAMSAYDSHALKEIFYKRRFSNAGSLDGHNLGNLFLVWAEKHSGDLMLAVRALEQAVDAVGHVYPATQAKTQLVAELTDGATIVGEDQIDRPNYDRSKNITRVWLEPAGSADAEAVRVIEQADYLLLGPGSLYASIIAAILPDGIREAMIRSRAKIIFVAGNKFEQHGETGPTVLSEYIATLETYLPRKVDAVIYDSNELTTEQQKYYEQKQWGIIEFDATNLAGRNIIAKPFEKPEGGLSSILLGEILKQVLS